MPFFHPLTTIALGIILVIYELTAYACNYIERRPNNKLNLNSIFILVIAFITWISIFLIFNRKIQSLFSSIKNESVSPIDGVVSSFNKLDMGVGERLIFTLKMYFPNIILSMLALSAIIYIRVLRVSVRLPPFCL